MNVMKSLALDLVLVLAVLMMAGLVVDGAFHLYRHLRRRRHSRGGAVGVVIDREGRLLGTYLDPFAHPWRSARMHGPESPWSKPGPWGEPATAWEGFGETEEEAFMHANRLRRRQVQLFGLLEPDEDDGRPDWMTAKAE
jgi:hypothetical protein